MPIVELHLMEGYGAEEKRRLATGLANAVRSVIPAAPEAVTVMLNEVARDGYFRDGPREPAPALPDPTDTVRAFLAAMEQRDLNAAQAHLGEGFTMHFPGTAPMTELADLIAWAKPRYRFVTKSFEGFDTVSGADGSIVYCRGTLSGEWPDGSAFSGIRFIDRFELAGGKITRQDVWNDIAEVRG